MLKILKATLRKIKIYNIIGHLLILFALFNTFFISNSKLWLDLSMALAGFMFLLILEISKSLDKSIDKLCDLLGLEFDDNDDNDETEE